MVTRRCQGESLRSIGQDFDLTRERVRQITVKVAPWEPWEAVRRAHEIELEDAHRINNLVLASLSDRPCEVCGQPMNDPSQARRFCAPPCRNVWERLSYHTDPNRRAQAKRAQARYIIDNAERLPATQVRFAERVLSGEVGTDRGFRWMVEGTAAFETAVEAVLKNWPIALQLPASVRRQIYEHLGWDWEGDPEVLSGSESLRDADWIGGVKSAGSPSPYSDVLTKEFLEDAYLDAGFSGTEIAELVGCAVATVYSAMRRFGIQTRGGSPGAAGLGDILTSGFLEAEYVAGRRSAPSIADEVGCDPSTVYAALRRHGIATRGSSAAEWRDTAELVDAFYLTEQYSENSRTPADIASSLGIPSRHVLDALRHHGLLERVPASGDYQSVLTKAFLTTAYAEKGLSGNAIAEEVGCHPTTVYEALRRHGIRAEGQGGRTRWEAVLTKEYLLNAYVERGLSGGQIAGDVGCTPSIVYAWLERHGIQRREARETRSRSGAADWNPVWLREQYLAAGRSAADIADELGVPAPTLYTALRRFGIRKQ
jgi:transposase